MCNICNIKYGMFEILFCLIRVTKSGVGQTKREINTIYFRNKNIKYATQLQYIHQSIFKCAFLR